MLRSIEHPALRAYSTMAVDSVADWLVEWETADDVQRLFSDDAFAGVVDRPVIPVGEGSNLLFVSNPLHATLLRCTCTEIVELPSDMPGDMRFKVSAGTTLDGLVEYAVGSGLWGIENLSMIPGAVGAAAVQNPGAYGQEFGEVVEAVECYDRQTGQMVTLTRDALGYAYRFSALKAAELKWRMIVVSVTVVLTADGTPTLSYGGLAKQLEHYDNSDLSELTPADMRRIVSEIRSAKLPEPAQTPSCGSFFMNPVVDAQTYATVVARAEAMGIDPSTVPAYPQSTADGAEGYKLSAAWLIDRSGWKGKSRGPVALWPQQPLVIVNPDGKATGRLVADFAAEISADVAEKWGVTLRPEVEYL